MGVNETHTKICFISNGPGDPFSYIGLDRAAFTLILVCRNVIGVKVMRDVI